MKKLIILVIFFFISPVWAEVFDCATVLAPKRWSLGIEPQLVIEPREFQLNTHVGYGINSFINSHARLGIGTIPFYLGSDIEIAILRDIYKQPALSLTSGLHYLRSNQKNVLGIDFRPTISKKFVLTQDSTHHPYLALDGDISLSNKTTIPLSLVLGTELARLNSSWVLVLEGGLNLNDNMSWVVAGVNFTFADWDKIIERP